MVILAFMQISFRRIAWAWTSPVKGYRIGRPRDGRSHDAWPVASHNM